MPSDAAAMCAALDVRVRHHEPSDAAAICAAIDFETGHHVPYGAALPAVSDTERGTMCQAMLPPCVQLLIGSEARVPGDAAAMHAAIDSKRGISS